MVFSPFPLGVIIYGIYAQKYIITGTAIKKTQHHAIVFIIYGLKLAVTASWLMPSVVPCGFCSAYLYSR